MRKQKGLRLSCVSGINGRMDGRGRYLPSSPQKPSLGLLLNSENNKGGFPVLPHELLQPRAAGMDLGVLQQGLSHQPHTKHE